MSRWDADTAMLARCLTEAQDALDRLDQVAICADGLTAYVDGSAALSRAQSIIEGSHRPRKTISYEDSDLLETIICDQPVAAQQRALIARQGGQHE